MLDLFLQSKCMKKYGKVVQKCSFWKKINVLFGNKGKYENETIEAEKLKVAVNDTKLSSIGMSGLKKHPSRSEIIFSKNRNYLEFDKYLLEPTIVTASGSLSIPEIKKIPPNIPNHTMLNVSKKYDSKSWVYPPKPLQEAHEHFLFDFTSQNVHGGEIVSPEDRFKLHIDETFRRLSKAICGGDLVEILKNDWIHPNEIMTSKTESLRRTMEVICQLGQIKQFAFLKAAKIENLIADLIGFCDERVGVLSTDQLADMFWCFAKLGARPKKVVDKMVAKIESKISEFNMSELSDIFYSFQELRIDSAKVFKEVENGIVSDSPRSLRELAPAQVFQLAYAVILGYKPQNQQRKLCWHLCKHIGQVWKTKPFVPISAMLQICRFSTAITMFFPGEKFKGLIPNDLREKALFVFKSGRAEMYSPPFLDPFTRETVKTHFSTMRLKQTPISLGLNGWWIWSFDRRYPAFSLEPASETWYTRFDDQRRMLGSYIFRNRIIERHGLLTLHIPYYEWDLLTTKRSRYKYFHRKMSEQLGVTSHLKDKLLVSNMFGVELKGRHYKKDDIEITKDTDIAWDWNELCEINAKHLINPNVYLNDANFRTPHAVYNDHDRKTKVDFWND